MTEFPQMGIAAGTKYVPPARYHLRDWAKSVGASGARLLPSMLENGLAHFHVAHDMGLEALSCAGVERLLDQSALRSGDVDLVIFCHTNTTSVMAAPASMPALLAKRFGMRRALCYSVSQQSCASVMCALRMLRTLMWRHRQLCNVLVVSTDKVFGERFRNVSNYAIQSDGSMALWISRDWPRNRLGHMSYNVDPIYYKGAQKGPELGQRFALNYPLLAHRMIAEVMARSGWTPGQVDAVLPMNANLSAFARVTAMLGLPAEKLYSENIGAVGHMFSCDPFLNFLDCFARPDRIDSGNAILFASASTGVFTALGISHAWTGPEPAAVRTKQTSEPEDTLPAAASHGLRTDGLASAPSRSTVFSRANY
jgi:3-oxoacyl-[acyl-carrier-protein] synthase-3